MKRFFWFVIFNFIGVFLITSLACPEMSIKQQMALILGIQCIATSLDFLDHLNKED